jgi:hypothetical protein
MTPKALHCHPNVRGINCIYICDCYPILYMAPDQLTVALS